MHSPNIANTVVDEANHRTYVIMASRVLTDGEIYRAIRREILRRGGNTLAQGETLTMTITSSGGIIASAAEPEAQKESPSVAMTSPVEADPFTSSPGSLE